MLLAPPLGTISKADENFRDTMASSRTFRSWVGADSPETAKQRIFIDSTDLSAFGDDYDGAAFDAIRPFAVIFESDVSQVRIGTDTCSAVGTIGVHVEDSLSQSEDDNPSELGRRFRNIVGQIINEMFLEENRHLNINQIDFLGPFREAKEEQPGSEDYIFATLTVSWGQGQ